MGVEKMMSVSPLNFFTIITFTLFLLSTLIFVYISYRLLFAYIIFLDTPKSERFSQKAFFYIKESYLLTA